MVVMNETPASVSQQPTNAPGSVTRVEIIDAIGHAFDESPLTREDLLAAAVEHDARPGVLDQLRRLPAATYRKRSDLWSHLSDVPVEH